MFIGHFAVAFGAKKYAPRVSLGVLFLACQLADIIWPNLVLLGIEKVEVEPGITAMTPLNFLYYPWSHSLVALLLWSVLFAVLYFVLRRSGTRAALVIAAVALSHWVLDVLTHRPDIPVTLNGPTLLGPPPPSATAVAWSAQALWLLIAWGFWVDRNRAVR